MENQNSAKKTGTGTRDSKYKWLWIAIQWAMTFALLAVIFSCGGRKKTVTERIEKSSQETTIDSTSITKAALSVSSDVDSSEIRSWLSESVEFDGSVGDTLSIEKFGADGKLLSRTRISGKGKAVMAKSETQSLDRQRSTIAADAESSTQSAVRKKSTGSNSTSAYSNEVSTTSSCFWNWLWAMIILLIVIVLAYFYNKAKLFL